MCASEVAPGQNAPQGDNVHYECRIDIESSIRRINILYNALSSITLEKYIHRNQKQWRTQIFSSEVFYNLKTLFNIVEERLKKILNFGVSAA